MTPSRETKEHGNGMSAAFRKKALQKARSAPSSKGVPIAAGFAQLQTYSVALTQVTDPTVAQVIADAAAWEKSPDSQAVSLLFQHSGVVSVAEESAAELVHVQHNLKLFESELCGQLKSCNGYDDSTLLVSSPAREEGEVQAALETYKLLLQAVRYDAGHDTILQVGNKDVLGGWKVQYNDAETGDQPFSEWEQRQVVFSATGKHVLQSLIAHAKLQQIVSTLQGIVHEKFGGDYTLQAADVMFPGLSRNIHFKYHNDKNDTPCSPDITCVYQPSPGKSSMRIATADNAAEYKGPGDWKLFLSDSFHRTCRTELRTVKVTFFFARAVLPGPSSGKTSKSKKLQERGQTQHQAIDLDGGGEDSPSGEASGSGSVPGVYVKEEPAESTPSETGGSDVPGAHVKEEEVVPSTDAGIVEESNDSPSVPVAAPTGGVPEGGATGTQTDDNMGAAAQVVKEAGATQEGEESSSDRVAAEKSNPSVNMEAAPDPSSAAVGPVPDPVPDPQAVPQAGQGEVQEQVGQPDMEEAEIRSIDTLNGDDHLLRKQADPWHEAALGADASAPTRQESGTLDGAATDVTKNDEKKKVTIQNTFDVIEGLSPTGGQADSVAMPDLEPVVGGSPEVGMSGTLGGASSGEHDALEEQQDVNVKPEPPSTPTNNAASKSSKQKRKRGRQ